MKKIVDNDLGVKFLFSHVNTQFTQIKLNLRCEVWMLLHFRSKIVYYLVISDEQLLWVGRRTTFINCPKRQPMLETIFRHFSCFDRYAQLTSSILGERIDERRKTRKIVLFFFFQFKQIDGMKCHGWHWFVYIVWELYASISVLKNFVWIEMVTMGYGTARMCRTCESGQSLVSLSDAENKSIVKKLRACADISVSGWNCLR